MTRIPCVIFDLDGTLANCDHRRHFVEGSYACDSGLKTGVKFKANWPAFYDAMVDDVPNEAVAWLFRTIKNNTQTPTKCSLVEDALYPVPVISTGRPDEYQRQTEDWLFYNSLHPHALYMRAEGDYRPDNVVKREFLTRILADGYDPIFVVDDRNSVVAMWREAGLTCLQCAPGDF